MPQAAPSDPDAQAAPSDPDAQAAPSDPDARMFSLGVLTPPLMRFVPQLRELIKKSAAMSLDTWEPIR